MGELTSGPCPTSVAPVVSITLGNASIRWPGRETGLTAAGGAFETIMKIKNSIKSLRIRHRDNRVVRRRGRLYVINKTIKRYKARQG